MKVSGTATSAELKGTQIKGNGGGTGITAAGKKVTMTNVDISKVQLGVEVKAGDLTITGGSIKGVKWGINMEGGKKLVIKEGTTISFTDGYGVKIQNNVTAELMGTVITGNGGGTGVTAEGTGNVTMTSVNISQVQVGVKVTGNGALTIIGGWIREVQTGIDMEKGTLVVKDGTRIEFTGTHGVKVGTAVTSATLTGVMIRGDGKGMGVWMEGTGNVTLTSVDISKVQLGVEVKKGTGTMTITGGSMTDVQMGIDMAGSGTLTVEDGTRIEFKGTHGVKVGGSVTSATLTGVTIRGTGGDGTGTGVHAEGGKVTVTGGWIREVQTGIDMAGKGTLTVSGTEIQFKNGHGVRVGEKVTSATLTNVQIKGTDGKGMGVHAEGGNLTVKGGSITNVLTGIDMAGSGTLKVEDGTRISFKGTHGIGVWGDVTVSLTGTKIMGEGNGSDGSSTGIGVIMAGKTMTMDKVDISGVAMGVYAGSGTLEIKEGTISFAKTYGVKVGGSVTSTELTRVTIVGEGKGTGVYAGGKTMMITGGSITNVQMGVRVMAGELEIKDGTVITVTENGYGVGVWGGTATAELTEVTIKGEGKDKGIGVIMAGSSGTMKDVRISGVGMGVYVMRGEVMMDKVDISGVQTGIEVESGTLEVLGESGNSTINFTGDYGVKVGASVTSAELTKVTIKGGDQGKGTGIYAEGKKVTMTLDKVGISGVVMGVNMLEGEMLEIKGSSTISFKAGYGVRVGDKVKSARLMGTQITGDGSGYGVWAMGKMMTMDKVNISNVQMGVEVKAGNLTITGGSIKEVQTGIAMLGNGMLKVEEKTEIQFRNGYGVYVGEKVQSATLMGTVITGGKAGYGVYAKGGRVMVSGGSIKEVGMGIRVLAGDLTVRDGTTIHFIGDGAGVYVEEKVKSATLTKVTIRGTGGDGSTGVIMESSGTMTDVDISNVQMGVTAMGGAVTITGGSIKEVEKGIVMIGDGMLMVKGKTEIQFEKGDGYGVYMEGSVNASLMDVTITGEEKKGTGVYAEGGKVWLENVHISEVGTGVEVMRGEAWLKETHLGNVAKGMNIENGDVYMEKGSIEFDGEHGIHLKQGNVDLRGVSMTYTGSDKTANFINVEGGTVLALGVTINGNDKGQGLKVTKRGTVGLKNTTFANVRSGMSITDGSVLMFGGGITFKGGHGISVSGGQALLNGFSIMGSDNGTSTGVGISNLGKVMMKGVDISKVGMGVRVVSGLLMMDKGSITFKGEHGINLILGQAMLNGVNIIGPGGNKGTGVEMSYGQLWMTGTTLRNVAKGMTITDGSVRMEGGSIEFEGEHGIDLIQGQVALMVVKMAYRGNNPTADFIKITGEDTTNAVKRIYPEKRAVVVAANLTINGNGHGQGLHVIRGGRVVLMKPTYTDVYNGMTIKEGAVQVLGGEMTFKGEHAVYLNRGHALLTNVAMKYTGDNDKSTFLKVEAKGNALNTADIRGTGIKIEGNGHVQGVHVENGGRVMLESAVFSNIKNGVTVLNGEFWMKKGEIEFKGEHAVSLSTGKVVLNGVIMNYGGDRRVKRGANSTKFIKVEGKGANLTAVKVMIIGNDNGQADGLMV
ncbi:right-handed parallel beta-helix repeat-containing protein [Bartonella sp. WD16.2]|uniref:right-handed parallel beta-helix repeat-containing protein n=1 Tax=Bartonella sp. WD16.2 TaxID=1933904 RepID=UPI00099AAFC4|nr:right-handed parallel beta-helix repeat-containing protein [Bartonella sp. WD16.2]AQX19233.1 Right handed beta helix region [Bartonella sp. WD16.2]